MNGPESSGEQEHKDITRTTEHFSDAVINRGPMEPISDQVNELTGSETELFLLNSQDVIKAIRNMIDHEVEAKEVDHSGVRYKFINLIGHHRLTNDLYEELEEQSVHGHAHLGEKLLEEVEQIVIPKLDQGIRMGRNVRPVTSGGKSKAKAAKSLKTSYPGYKEGVHSSKNRVIILKVDEPGSEIPAYAVVALFDHDDDGDIYRTLFRSTK